MLAVLAVAAGLLVAERREASAPPAFSSGGRTFGRQAVVPPTPDADASAPAAPAPDAGQPAADGTTAPPDAAATGATPEATGTTPPPPTRGATSPATSPPGGEPTGETASGSSAGTAPAAPGSSGGTAASGAGSPAPSSSPTAPATGSYLYALDGWEATSAPGSRREFPDTATVSAHSRQDGPDGTRVTLDLEYSDSHAERMVVRYGQAGVAVLFEGGKVDFFAGLVSQTSQVRYEPPVLRIPADPEQGASWQGRSEARDGDGSVVRSERYQGRVRGTEMLDVAGQRVRTVVIEWESQFSGEERGWRRQTIWYSPQHAMWVKLHDRVHGERFNFSYDKDATLTLRRLPT